MSETLRQVARLLTLAKKDLRQRQLDSAKRRAQHALEMDPEGHFAAELKGIIQQASGPPPGWLPEAPLPRMIVQGGPPFCSAPLELQLDEQFMAKGKKGRRVVRAAVTRTHLWICSGWDATKFADRRGTSIELRLFDQGLNLLDSESRVTKAAPYPPSEGMGLLDGRLYIGMIDTLDPFEEDRPLPERSSGSRLDGLTNSFTQPDGTELSLHGRSSGSLASSQALVVHEASPRELKVAVAGVLGGVASHTHLFLVTCVPRKQGRSRPKLVSIALDSSGAAEHPLEKTPDALVVAWDPETDRFLAAAREQWICSPDLSDVRPADLGKLVGTGPDGTLVGFDGRGRRMRVTPPGWGHP